MRFRTFCELSVFMLGVASVGGCAAGLGSVTLHANPPGVSMTAEGQYAAGACCGVGYAIIGWCVLVAVGFFCLTAEKRFIFEPEAGPVADYKVVNDS